MDYRPNLSFLLICPLGRCRDEHLLTCGGQNSPDANRYRIARTEDYVNARMGFRLLTD